MPLRKLFGNRPLSRSAEFGSHMDERGEEAGGLVKSWIKDNVQEGGKEGEQTP
jgi:hypothetical protein